MMHIRILDLDSFSERQPVLLGANGSQRVSLLEFGPRLRIACSWRAYRDFKAQLDARISKANAAANIVFVGSGDFHHLTLALLEMLKIDCNLLVIDKHPDWMRGVPFLHCGTWLAHAARLPNIHKIIHAGGELDFDNGYRWFAPWEAIQRGRILVIPATRRFERGKWRNVNQAPLRAAPDQPVARARIDDLIAPVVGELAKRPLYISIDKDVLSADEAICNWDQGCLRLAEVVELVHGCVAAAGGRLAGADIVGDWSPVVMHGVFRRILHQIEHPHIPVDPQHAAETNQRTNLRLIECLIAADRGSN